MRKSRIELEIALNAILEKNNKNKDVLNSFIKGLEGKFYRGKVVRIFDKSIQLTLLSNEELCLVTTTLYNIMGYENINPELWFLESEARDASKIYLMDGEEDTEPIVELKGFLRKGKRDEWTGYLSYKQIHAMYEKGYLTYNQETQRKAKIIERATGRIVCPTIFKSSVNRIAKKMMDGKFYTNAVTLNVTKTFREELFYDSEKMILRVPINTYTELAIIDGAHRILGIVKAFNMKPELDDYIAVNIKNLTVDEAQEFIYQESLTNKQDLSALRKNSTRDTYMEMAKTIARMGDSETNVLFNRIGFLETGVNECLCTGERFAMGLKDNFKDLFEKSDSKQLTDITKYIVDFFDYIAKLCPHEYKGDYKLLEKRSISTCSNFYVGMLALARKLYDNGNWEERLELVLEDMTWDLRAKEWKERGVTVDNVNLKTKRKLYDYFASL